jgi:hypothetical protein
MINNLLKKLNCLKNYFPETILFLIAILFTLKILNFEKNFINYIFVENLINYQGGFIRRGFLGSIAYFFYETFNINPKFFFITIYYILYIFLILIFLNLINSLKKENYYLAVIIILSPATFLFLIFDNGAIFRKEIFFILIFFIHVIVAKKVFNRTLPFQKYLKFNLFLIFPGLFINILIHEFQFFLLFFHFLINLFVFDFSKKKIGYFKYFYLFLTTVFILIVNAGNENTVINIERSLEVFIPNIMNDYGPTDMLNGNINLVIGSFLKMIISSNYFEFLQVFLMLCFSILLFLFIFNNLIKKNKFNLNNFDYRNYILLILIFITLIIFIVTAFDYGRLFHIFTMHVIGFYLILPPKTFRFRTKSFSEKFMIPLSIFTYFLFFSMPHAHILMGKGSMYLNYGNGIINYIIQNFEPFIQRILL